MKPRFLFLIAALSTSACTLNLNLVPEIPQSNYGPRIPMKVAVIVPQASRQITQAASLPTGCFTMAITPAPHGDIFVQTLQGVFGQYFDSVVMLENAPAPDDAQLVVEATLSSIGVKFACLASPDFYGEAKGTFRAVDSNGGELWRSGRTSSHVTDGLPMSMGPYQTIMPKAMAALASSWASDIAMSSLVRGEAQPAARPVRRAAPSAAPAAGDAWWKKDDSGSQPAKTAP